ncbi:MAG: site-2 protease family protein [bacterium]|nr:site-2 protease family protein [bacterium]
MLDIYFIFALVVAVTVHEFSHAWMASYLGDPTPRYMGRLTLNPLAHLDPIGTIMLFLAGFGWGKPVPFSMNYLRNPRVGSALIALAGPLSNLVMALIFGVFYRYLFFNAGDLSQSSDFTLFLFRLMKTMIDLNLVLMIFNLLPIPPLDGSKVFALLIPGDYIEKLYRFRNYGYVILILIVFSPTLFNVNILGQYIIYPVVKFFSDVILFSS